MYIFFTSLLEREESLKDSVKNVPFHLTIFQVELLMMLLMAMLPAKEDLENTIWCCKLFGRKKNVF